MSSCTSLLKEMLEQNQSATRILVAFSGGEDSTALLHALSSFNTKLPIVALHVNHQLNPMAESWANDAVLFAKSCGIACEILKVTVNKGGQGLEAAAREARYLALREKMLPGDILLTAHHQADQAETFLLQAMRGAGLLGLSAMPEKASFGAGFLLRPWLTLPKKEISDYIRSNHLTFIQDPMNFDCSLSRSALRQEVMPELKKQAQSLEKNLALSAKRLKELLSWLRDDLKIMLDNAFCVATQSLSWQGFYHYPFAKQSFLLKIWLQDLGCLQPSSNKITEFLVQLNKAQAQKEKCPMLAGQGFTLRAWAGRIYLTLNEAKPSKLMYDWENPRMQFKINELKCVVPPLLIEKKPDKPVTIRFLGGDGSHLKMKRETLKKRFQEAGVPPWLRSQTPLIFVGDSFYKVHYPF